MASVRDVILVGVMLFVTGIVFLTIHFATKVMVTNIVLAPAANQTNAPDAYKAFTDMNTSIDKLDYLIFACFIGMVLAIMVSGYFVGGNPVFMIFYFLILVIGVVFSMVLSNVWHTVATDTIFATILPGYSPTGSFPITNNLLSYLPMYTTVIGLLGMVVMFSRPVAENI